MHPDRIAWAAAALLGMLALVQTARLALLRAAPRRRLAKARERGRAGERGAATLLERAGYRIEIQQPELSWTILCDGEPLAVALRADLLVSRGGQRFVAEIKTGQSAPRLHTPGTRRQLLEYSVAYAVDGVLLVDMELERIHEVRFPLATQRRPARSGLALTALLLLLLALCWLWLRHAF